MAAVPSEGHAAAVPSRFAPEGEATRLLYERHQRKILSFCKHQLGSREEAEDATQITFMNAFRGIKRGASPEFESAWLFKIAHNVCLTKQRSSYRRRLVEAPNDFQALSERVPAYEGDTDELFGLDTALRVVPEQQRRALLLREWQGLSYKEIADEMRLSQAAVETLLFRARRSLADALTLDPAQKRKRGRPRATSNLGSGVALLKSLMVGGSVKVAATVATVAATSVVTATPAVRHDVLDAVGHRHASRPHAAPALAPRLQVAAPVVALAHHATSVTPATRQVPRKAFGETRIATPATRPQLAVAETQPSAPADRSAAATSPAVTPAPTNQLPPVPVPVPASAPAPVSRDVPPADPEPTPTFAPAPIVSPSMPSSPAPQSVPSVSAAPATASPTTTMPPTGAASPAQTSSGLTVGLSDSNWTKTVNEPAVTTPTVTTPAWVPPGQAKNDETALAVSPPAPPVTPATPVQTTTEATLPPPPPLPASPPVLTTLASTTPEPAPEWVPPGQAKDDGGDGNSKGSKSSKSKDG